MHILIEYENDIPILERLADLPVQIRDTAHE